VILVLCTLCVEVQGECVGLSMECVPPLFSGIEYDIEVIASMNDINLFMHNLRCRKRSTQACTPQCNCTKEYRFRLSDSLPDVIEFYIFVC